MKNKFEYEKFIGHAKKILDRYFSHIFDAGDLVGETFLKYGHIDDALFIEQMRRLAGNTTENKTANNYPKVQEDRRCVKCKQIYPAGAFRHWFLRGYLIYDSYCRDCKNKIVQISKKKRKNNERKKTN